MEKKVVIAGGTGFIGQYLQKEFLEMGYVVTIISRQSPHVFWEDQEGMVQSLEGAELLINLAGKSVDCRYNEKNKAEIFQSRTESTKALGGGPFAVQESSFLMDQFEYGNDLSTRRRPAYDRGWWRHRHRFLR